MIEFWLIAKIYLSKSWAFIKKYWQVFVGIIYTIVVWVYFKGQTDKIKEVLKVKEDSHRKELDVLNGSHTAEIALRDGALDKYHEIIAKIEKEYKDNKEELMTRTPATSLNYYQKGLGSHILRVKNNERNTNRMAQVCK